MDIVAGKPQILGLIRPRHGRGGLNKVAHDLFLGLHAEIDTTGGIEIGPGCVISGWAVLFTHYHDLTSSREPIQRDRPIIPMPKIIGPDVYIGERAIILPQARIIAKGCIVGAGAVVTHSMTKEYEVWVGNPAKCVGIRGGTNVGGQPSSPGN